VAGRPPSGHVFRVERARGPVWYAKYRLPDGRQVQEKIGPAWSERGRPATGYFTKRLADDWLRDLLHELRHGTLASDVRTGATFADAAAEWLRYIEYDRRRKPSTVVGYKVIVRSMLLPAFGQLQLGAVTTPMIERWVGSLELSASTRTKAIVLLHGVHRPAPRGAPCPHVARRRLRGLHDPRSWQLLRGSVDHAEVRQGPGRPDGAGRGLGPGAPR
jgi:integrase